MVEGFSPGRRVTAAYVFAQAILAAFASITAVVVGSVLIVAGLAASEASVTGVFDRGPEAVNQFFLQFIRTSPDLWPILGTSALTVAVMGGLLALFSGLRYRNRAKAPKGKRLTDACFIDPLPEGLRGHAIWHTTPRTLVERKSILLNAAAVYRATTGRVGYRYMIWHEWHHAATGDTFWAFVGGVFGRVTAVVVAFVLSFVITFLTPLMWAGDYAPLLVALFGFTMFVLAYRYSASVLYAFDQVKELLADSFAERSSGERAVSVYVPARAGGDDVRASPHFTRAAKEPTPAERLWFLEHGGTDRIFILGAGLFTNWIILRLVCSVCIAPIGVSGLWILTMLDLLMIGPAGMILWAVENYGARPRSFVGWGVLLMPFAMLLGVVVPFGLYLFIVLVPWLNPAFDAFSRAALFFPWTAACLTIVLCFLLIRRWRVASARFAGFGFAGQPDRQGWGTDALLKLAKWVGTLQSWAALVIGGLVSAYAIIVSVPGLHSPSMFDMATLLISALTAYSAYMNLMQLKLHEEKRLAWPLLVEVIGFSFMVGAFVYFSEAADYISLIDVKASQDFNYFLKRFDEYSKSFEIAIFHQVSAGTVIQAALSVMAPYTLRFWALRRMPAVDRR